jgi:hypothetical protein
MTALPIDTPLKITGSDMSTVLREMLDGFCNVVVRGETIYSLPSVPPLPVIDTLLREAVPPKELKPRK